MARIVYSTAALEDLERIVWFLLENSEDAAVTAVQQMRAAVNILAEHPRIGRRSLGTMRELVISYGASGYIALYRFDAPVGLVRMLRVRHQREAGFRD